MPKDYRKINVGFFYSFLFFRFFKYQLIFLSVGIHFQIQTFLRFCRRSFNSSAKFFLHQAGILISIFFCFGYNHNFIYLFHCGILGASFNSLWAFILWLQAYKGSHIVITTIMFNFIASALMVYLLAHLLIESGQQAPQTRAFAETAKLLSMSSILKIFAVDIGSNPFNFSFIIALFFAGAVWVYIWRTPWGYELRVSGKSEKVSLYAGIHFKKITIITLMISPH